MSKQADMIKGIRKLLGLSQEALAERIDYSVSSVRKWEKGKRTPRKRAMDAINELVKMHYK